MSEYTQGIDDIQPDQGRIDRPLKEKTRYLLRVVVTDQALEDRPYGMEEPPVEGYRVRAQVRMVLNALDPVTQEQTGEFSFCNMPLTADTHYFDNDAEMWKPRPEVTIPGSRKEKRRIIRSYEDERKRLIARVLGFMAATGVERGVDDGTVEGLFRFFNVDDWNEKVYVGEVMPLSGANNSVWPVNFIRVDDPENGLASLLPTGTQVEAVGVTL